MHVRHRDHRRGGQQLTTSRDRHATERDRGSDSDDCFVKHEFLLLGSSRQCAAVANSC
jgi:hypothetical protein